MDDEDIFWNCDSELEVDPDDYGVIIRTDGSKIWLGMSEKKLNAYMAPERFYTERSAEVFVILGALLMSDHPMAEHCRGLLADVAIEMATKPGDLVN